MSLAQCHVQLVGCYRHAGHALETHQGAKNSTITVLCEFTKSSKLSAVRLATAVAEVVIARPARQLARPARQPATQARVKVFMFALLLFFLFDLTTVKWIGRQGLWGMMDVRVLMILP